MSSQSPRGPKKRRTARKANPQAQMALAEHLRELRNRLIKSAVATVVGMVGGFFLYIPFMAYITEPLQRLASAEGSEASINYSAVGSSFNIMVEVSLVLGLVLASPVWLYQLWAFVTAGPAPDRTALRGRLPGRGRPALPGRDRGRRAHPAHRRLRPHRVHPGGRDQLHLRGRVPAVLPPADPDLRRRPSCCPCSWWA